MTSENRGLYIPHEIMAIPDLNLTERGLLAEIEFLDRQGECFASNEHFSNRLGLTKWHVSKIISSLRKKGYIHSKMFYKKGTKEIEKRIIKAKCLCHQKYNCAERLDPYCENDNTLLSKSQGGTNTNVVQYPTKLVESRVYPIAEITTPPIAEITTPPCENDNTPLSNSQYPYCEIHKDNLQRSFNKQTNKQSTKKHMSKKSELEEEFELIWKRYPRKDGKKIAKEKYIKVRKKGETTFEEVKNGLERYNEYIRVHEVDGQYTQKGSTWFNQESWINEYNLIKSKQSKKGMESFLWNQLEEPQERKNINDDSDFDFSARGNNHDKGRSDAVIIDYQSDISESF